MSQILFNANAGGGGGGSGIQTIDGDIGHITGATVSITGLSTAGASVSFEGNNATAMTFNVTDPNFNVFIGESSGNLAAVGNGAANNTALGLNTLAAVTSDSLNTAIGSGALSQVAGGSSANTAVGYNAGSAYLTTESNNISIGAGVTGVVTESNSIRIGQSNQTGIQILPGNASFINADNSGNTFVGSGSGNFTLSGTSNTALGGGVGGFFPLVSLTTGSNNTVNGFASGSRITTGTQNTGFGQQTLLSLVTGVGNTALGSLAGSAYTGAERYNISIGAGVVGVAGESHTLRIGNGTGTSNNQLNAAFVAGINGFTPSSPVMVTIDSVTDQLGTAAIPAAGIVTIQGDSGSITGSTVSIKGASTAGGKVSFTGSGTAMTFNVTDANHNTFIGLGAGNNTLSNVSNTGFGWLALQALTSGSLNTAFGGQCLQAVSSASNNTAVGQGALFVCNGGNNTAMGNDSGASITSGNNNTAVGYNNLLNLTSGASNIVLGSGAANNYTSSESNNIVFGAPGVVGESNVIRIGQNNSSGIQLTGQNTYYLHNTGGSATSIFLGPQTGNLTMSGTDNTAMGWRSMFAATSATNNTSFGYNTLNALTSGGLNVAMGVNALQTIVTGQWNTCIGVNAGSSWTGAESNNITLGNATGTIGESNVLRIGAGTGTGTSQINSAFISGIQGITVTGTAVLVSASDQLGIAVSSARFKDNIQDLTDSSVLDLKPKTFNYNVGQDRSTQTGLIAEEVYEVMPELVVLDKEGLPQTVKYHDLPVLLLLEIQKLRSRIETLEKRG